jgi:hypothetical protein
VTDSAKAALDKPSHTSAVNHLLTAFIASLLQAKKVTVAATSDLVAMIAEASMPLVFK